MTITNEIFEAFLRCPTKCFLQAEGASASGNIYAEWVRGEVESYRVVGAQHLTKRLSPIGSINGSLDRSHFTSANWRCVLDSMVRSQNLESRVHAIERMPSKTTALPAEFVPVRFVRANRPNNVDRVMLAFDALVLSETSGHKVDFGRIIHGRDLTSLRIKTAVLAPQVRKTIDKINELFGKVWSQMSRSQTHGTGGIHLRPPLVTGLLRARFTVVRSGRRQWRPLSLE